MKFGIQVGLGPDHIVLDGDPGSLPKGTQPPIFGPYLLWPNGSMDQDATWQHGRPRTNDIVLCMWGPSFPLPKRVQSHSQFSAHVYCTQTAGWIKVPLGTEVELDPSDIVLDGDPAPLPQKGSQPPLFGPCLL